MYLLDSRLVTPQTQSLKSYVAYMVRISRISDPINDLPNREVVAHTHLTSSLGTLMILGYNIEVLINAQ